MLGSRFIFQDSVPLNKSPCFALCCREVSAFPRLRLGFYWRSDFDVYASSFLPAYQPASKSSLKTHVAHSVYIVLLAPLKWNHLKCVIACVEFITGTLYLYGIIKNTFVEY